MTPELAKILRGKCSGRRNSMEFSLIEGILPTLSAGALGVVVIFFAPYYTCSSQVAVQAYHLLLWRLHDLLWCNRLAAFANAQ